MNEQHRGLIEEAARYCGGRIKELSFQDREAHLLLLDENQDVTEGILEWLREEGIDGLIEDASALTLWRM